MTFARVGSLRVAHRGDAGSDGGLWLHLTERERRLVAAAEGRWLRAGPWGGAE